MGTIVRRRLEGDSFEAIYFQLLYGGIRTRAGREWSLSRIMRAFRAELKLQAEESQHRDAR
jgi:hypothetical protein